MAAYKAGQRYLKNRVTGAVFTYKQSLTKLGDLELYEADDEGELFKVGSRPPPELNPTKTPEKEQEPAKDVAKTAVSKPATLPPVDKA